MGIIARALRQETRGITATEALRRLVQSSVTRSGVAVNEQNAMQLMAVFTAVRILSEAFAQVPLKVYRRMADGTREEARDHPMYKILHDQPNDEMTSFTLRETMLGHLALWGNAYCEISRNFQGDIIGLWPLLPSRTRPMRTKSGALVYETRIQKDPANIGDTQTVYLPAKNVLHVPGFGFDGMKGLSVIGTVREGIGLAFAYDSFGAYFFGNNTVPGLTLTTDQPMKKEQVDDLERRIKDNHEGLTNAQRLMILTNGLKPTQVGMPLADAQFVEQKKYSRSEIMGLYRIPAHMSNDTEKVSSWGTGIEQMSIGFVVYTMMPYFQRFEQAINMKLLGANAQANLYPEFDPEGFLRGDYKTRMDGYAIARQWGWMSVNDIKRRENEPTIGEQGDVYLQPLNYQGADKALEEPAVAPRGMPGTGVDIGVEAGGTPPATKSAQRAETRPIGPYEDWDACIADQLSKGHDQPTAEKICGALEADTEDAGRAWSHRHALAHLTDQILRREQADISAGIKKLLKRGSVADIPAWVESFYVEHRAWAVKQAGPVFVGIAESVGAREAARVQAATAAYVERICAESMEHLKRAMRGEEEMARVLGAWEHRSAIVAEREIVLAAEAFGGCAHDPAPTVNVTVAAPAVTVPITVQPAGVTVPVTVQPAEVRVPIQNSVTVPERSVTVEGTTLTVPERAVTLNVPERSVTVTNTVEPQPPTDLEITHDRLGNVTGLKRKPSKN